MRWCSLRLPRRVLARRILNLGNYTTVSESMNYSHRLGVAQVYGYLPKKEEPHAQPGNERKASACAALTCTSGPDDPHFPPSRDVIQGMAMKLPIMPPMLDRKNTSRMRVTRFR